MSWKVGKQHGQLPSGSQREPKSLVYVSFILNFQLFGSNFTTFVVVMLEIGNALSVNTWVCAGFRKPK